MALYVEVKVRFRAFVLLHTLPGPWCLDPAAAAAPASLLAMLASCAARRIVEVRGWYSSL
jgi:hypothetical protein